ncbi:TPR-like protein [Cerioporus squamosus]|nr:TPR-like protein [Cerioporus squamosus]
MSEAEQAGSSSTPGLAAGGDIAEKFKVANEKKAAGDEAFKKGDVGAALAQYHTALLYLKGLDKNATQRALGQPVPQPPPIEQASQTAEEKQKTEVDLLSEKIYANMSQCHIKRGNWKRAAETADEALRLNPKNYKAMFRKAKAFKEQGYFEKAEKILDEIIKDGEESDKAAAEAELVDVKKRDKEVTAQHNQKMKGFLNKEKIDLAKD